MAAVKRRGRPPGSKNKKTLAKEALQQKVISSSNELLLLSFAEVTQQVIAQAKEGSFPHQKLIFDRLTPVLKAQDGTTPDLGSIVINVTTTEGVSFHAESSSEEPEAAVERTINARRQPDQGQESAEVLSVVPAPAIASYHAKR